MIDVLTPVLMPRMTTEGKALLLLGCSETQVRSRGPLPALQLYNGPNFHTLRGCLRRYGWPPGLVVRILSARYGLLTPQTLILPYDQKMTRARGAELQPEVRAHLRPLGPVEVAFINVGPLYQMALPDDLSTLIGTAHITWAQGGLGFRQHAMKAWVAALPRPVGLLRFVEDAVARGAP